MAGRNVDEETLQAIRDSTPRRPLPRPVRELAEERSDRGSRGVDRLLRLRHRRRRPADPADGRARPLRPRHHPPGRLPDRSRIGRQTRLPPRHVVVGRPPRGCLDLDLRVRDPPDRDLLGRAGLVSGLRPRRGGPRPDLSPDAACHRARHRAVARWSHGSRGPRSAPPWSKSSSRPHAAGGSRKRRVIGKHALRSALIPVVTITGLVFGFLIAGAVARRVHVRSQRPRSPAHPGVRTKDFPVVQGVTLVFIVAFIVINLLVDLLYAAVDPACASKGRRRRWRRPRPASCAPAPAVHGARAEAPLAAVVGSGHHRRPRPGGDLRASDRPGGPERCRPHERAPAAERRSSPRDGLVGERHSLAAHLRDARRAARPARRRSDLDLVGVPSACSAATAGGIVDGWLARVWDVLFAFPPLLLAIVIVAAFGAGFWTSTIAIAIVYMPLLARVVRGVVLVERERPTSTPARSRATPACGWRSGTCSRTWRRPSWRPGHAQLRVRAPRSGGPRVSRPRRAAAHGRLGPDAHDWPGQPHPPLVQ